MPSIHLTTVIHAPIERVFDLSRSIRLHKISMQHTKEEAVAGITSGLIKQGETVTWKAKHLFKKRVLKSRITEMKLYSFFEDEMVHGDFKMMKHRHYFKPIENGTIVIDEFEFETPYGNFGEFCNKLFLTAYVKNLLEKRNNVIKEYAESNKWKMILDLK